METGIGLPPGASAYLGTVTFHIDQPEAGTFEVSAGAFGPRGTDGIANLARQNIASATAFNSAVSDAPEPSAPAALASGVAALAALQRQRRRSAER